MGRCRRWQGQVWKAVEEPHWSVPPPGVDVGQVDESVLIQQVVMHVHNIHLLVWSQAKLGPEELLEVPDREGSWTGQVTTAVRGAGILLSLPAEQVTNWKHVPGTVLQREAEQVFRGEDKAFHSPCVSTLFARHGDAASCRRGYPCVELSPLAHLIFEKSWHQLVDNVLQRLVRSDVDERPGLVHLDVAHGADLVQRQVAHDARLAEGMQTLDDGGGVNKVTPAEDAGQVRIQLHQLFPSTLLHLALNSSFSARYYSSVTLILYVNHAK